MQKESGRRIERNDVDVTQPMVTTCGLCAV